MKNPMPIEFFPHRRNQTVTFWHLSQYSSTLFEQFITADTRMPLVGFPGMVVLSADITFPFLCLIIL